LKFVLELDHVTYMMEQAVFLIVAMIMTF